MIIGERLKGFIKRHGFTAKSFAETIGISEAMVYKYYKMDNIDSKTLMKWAEILSVPMMIFVDDDMYEKYVVPKTKEEIRMQCERFDALLENKKQKQMEHEQKEQTEERLLTIIESQQRIIESQQRTIELMQEQAKKILAQTEESATCASASGFELGK